MVDAVESDDLDGQVARLFGPRHSVFAAPTVTNLSALAVSVDRAGFTLLA